MRTFLRAGTLALATTSTLLGGAVAAQAAPTAARPIVSVNRLIFTPQQYGHTGSIRIAIRNTTAEPLTTLRVTEPIAETLDNFDGDATGCVNDHTADGRTIVSCFFDIAPGDSRVVTAGFRSVAAPKRYAQVASTVGSVEVGGATATFPALFRSAAGSLRNPRTYVADTTPAITVAASNATLTRQADGSFAGSVPVEVRNDSDAGHYDVRAELATPAGIDPWATLDGAEMCGFAIELPIPSGGEGTGCYLDAKPLYEGERRTITWHLTAPAGTPLGELGTATTQVLLSGPATGQTNLTNVDTFTVTIAG